MKTRRTALASIALALALGGCATTGTSSPSSETSFEEKPRMARLRPARPLPKVSGWFLKGILFFILIAGMNAAIPAAKRAIPTPSSRPRRSAPGSAASTRSLANSDAGKGKTLSQDFPSISACVQSNKVSAVCERKTTPPAASVNNTTASESFSTSRTCSSGKAVSMQV